MKARPKFVVDVGVSNIVENWIESQGFDVLKIRTINPKMSDLEILKLARKEKRIVITMDKDFGELVFRSAKKHHGVLLLRLDDATSDEKLSVMKEIFSTYFGQLKGHFCVFQNQTLRIR